eukprot:jgi/Ulvmu1/12395/UM009_0041.1
MNAVDRAVVVAKERCKNILASSGKKPKLCVIDLDYTLWPCYCECTFTAPRTYPEAVPLLDALQEASIPVAVASRSPTPHIARSYLHQLGLFDRLVGFECYPSSSGKDKHLTALSRATGVELADMIFFDDEHRNIEWAQQQGVKSVLVDDGLTVDSLRTAMDLYNNESGTDSAS